MNISYVENHSMDKFHNDEDIQLLVEICLKNYDTFLKVLKMLRLMLLIILIKKSIKQLIK